MDDDRRKYPRIKIKQMVLIHNQKEITNAKVKDISKSGLSFTTQVPIEPNINLKASITLQFTENKTEIINCEGLVIYCFEIENTFNSGLEFSAVSDAHKEILKEFIESQTY